jgi:hypothetical protein
MRYKCCICGHNFEGFGNDAWPVVRDDGARCCDKCNEDKVIPERINLIMGYSDGTEQSK